MTDHVIRTAYDRSGYLLNEQESIYKGEMVVTTSRGDNCLIKKIYIRSTFIEGNTVHIEAENKDLAIEYDAKTLQDLINNNIINKDDGEKLINEIRSEENKMQEYASWLKENPNATEDEKHAHFNNKINRSLEEETVKQSISLRRLIALKDVINKYKNELKSSSLFSYNIDHQTDFGMTKSVADGLANLPELIYEAKFEPLIDNTWRLSAKIKGKSKGQSNERGIDLEYTFLASSQEEAERIAESYKDTLRKGGLKALLCYWKKASDTGLVTYSCPLREVMELSSPKRNSYYNMEERKRFWALTRILENTKMVIPLQQKKNNKKVIVRAEHRLLEVLGRSVEEEDGCPIEVKVRLVDPAVFEDKTQIATAIANNILTLDENDILLGFSLEVRASQRRDFDTIRVDNNYLLEKGNLSKRVPINVNKERPNGFSPLGRIDFFPDPIFD